MFFWFREELLVFELLYELFVGIQVLANNTMAWLVYHTHHGSSVYFFCLYVIGMVCKVMQLSVLVSS